MKRCILWLLAALTGALQATAENRQVQSPDGRLTVEIACDNGMPTYSISYDGQTLVEPSRLGLTTSIGNYAERMRLCGVEETLVERHYDMTHTKAGQSDFRARQADVLLRNADGHPLTVTFMVANHDVAFRYTLQRHDADHPKCAIVTAEQSVFRFPAGTTAFLSPQSDPMIGWERTKPSYEEVYSADAPLDTPSQYGHGYVFPALYHVGDRGWVLLSETGVTSAYCGAHLSDYDAATGYTIAYPMEGENNGFGSAAAAIAVPGSTPWRTLTVGPTLAPIVETTISFDLVEPLYPPSVQYQPGRYTWSWLIGQDASINYADQVRFIDLAAQMGFEYCLVDNWWDERIGRERMEELSRYARQRGVSLMLWYNSNGYENDAPQTPRHCMNTAIAREREMSWLRAIGVKGIKVDFFGGDKQQTMQLYEDILSDANRYGLQVIFHGCTLPRGWERLYPNYVASEAVLASENVFFGEDHARREPFDLTLHPFCRNAVGAMDWGGIIMNRHLSTDNRSRHRRQTTDVFEMASGITMQTAVQCVAMQPNNLDDVPQTELDFLRLLPTTWDESRFVDGYPGRYVVLARRHGSQWYVAGLNAEPQAKQLTLRLPMLAGQSVSYYTDDAQGYARLSRLSVNQKGEVRVRIQPNGGIILAP